MATGHSPSTEPLDPDLGELLFTRRQNPGFGLLLTMCLVLGGIGVLAITESAHARQADGIWVGVILIGLAAAIATYIFIRSRKVLRCHERGVSMSGWGGDYALRFDAAATMKFRIVRIVVHGIPVATTFRLELEPQSGAEARSIAFSGTLKKNDPDLDLLRDLAARAIAVRMSRALNADGRVAWTRHLAFQTEGIEYRPVGFFGRKRPVLLPYDEIANTAVADGMFSLSQRGRKRAVVCSKMSEPNFFPGYKLLLTILEHKHKLVAGGDTKS